MNAEENDVSPLPAPILPKEKLSGGQFPAKFPSASEGCTRKEEMSGGHFPEKLPSASAGSAYPNCNQLSVWPRTISGKILKRKRE